MRLFLCNLLCISSLTAGSLSPDEATLLGKKIFFNECSNNSNKLIHWNQKEEFPSLGIGHFIWYPENNAAPFEETFPDLMQFFAMHHIPLPSWLFGKAPWKEKQEMNLDQERKIFLKSLLSSTLALQAEFIYERFERSTAKLLDACENKEAIEHKLELLTSSAQGRFALVDYIHFKGDGLSSSETHQGKGWGLKQVLEAMDDNPHDPVAAFKNSAEKALRERVSTAPKERSEEQWLQGWLNRVHRY